MNGIFTALLTPFCSDGSINRSALEKLKRFNIDSGVHGFYVGGSTAEAMMIPDTLRKEIFEIVKGTAGNAVKLIAHVGSTATDSAIDMALAAKNSVTMPFPP